MRVWTQLTLALGLVGLIGCSPALSPAAEPSRSPAARLALESSPYLQQHADNLVEWYPWGEEAFAKARAQNKPIFLSVGYSTCHWCHVMEEESFMAPEVARALNANFVSIKVDRETRPDIDRLYMGFLVDSTGGGGWPMSVFLTPDAQPFLAGTYYPHPAKYGRMGFLELLTEVAREWGRDPDSLKASAAEIAQRMSAATLGSSSSDQPAREKTIEAALRQWTSRFDKVHGGFGPPPKFPQAPVLGFLLLHGAMFPDSDCESMALRTLKRMAQGGLHDHLEGGFHRYSTDEAWRIPHFEKMLSDQAQLLSLYSRAYLLTGDLVYKDAAQGLASYLLGRLSVAEGGLASAEDADSVDPEDPTRHREGAFYLWTEAELGQVLNVQELKLVKDLFGVTAQGNAGAGELAGRNVLALARPVEPRGADLAPVIDRLRAARDKRPRPNRDEKVLAAWNAMAAGALAEASVALSRPELLQRAKELLAYLESALVVNGRMQRSLLEGKPAQINAFAQDHAELVAAYLAVYSVDGDPSALRQALFWQARLDRDFADASHGGYFETLADHGLLFRDKERRDGALASTASRSAMNLAILFRLTGKDSYRESYQALLGSVAEELRESPWSLPGVLAALDLMEGPEQYVVLVGDRTDWWSLLRQGYHPQRRAHWLKSDSARQALSSMVPFLGSLPRAEAVYFCQNSSCGLPITQEAELRRRLAGLRP